MKTIVEKNWDDGLDALLGEMVSLWCVNYIYTGKLTGVDDTCVKLEDAAIVYETGPFAEKGWKDAQSLPWRTHYISRSAIESFGGVK